MKKKTKWESPKLIVLLRGRPEEMLGIPCKTTTSGGGYDNVSGKCARGTCGSGLYCSEQPAS